jgi:virginiamycin B lyase
MAVQIVVAACALVLGSCATSSPPAPPFETHLTFEIPDPEAQPTPITATPDGTVWFSELSSSLNIGRITPDGKLTVLPPPAPRAPIALTPGPDGALWYAAQANQIGRIASDGTIISYPIHYVPGSPTETNVFLQDLTSGPDGALWFTASTESIPPYGGVIGRMTTSGMVTWFSLPIRSAAPVSIVTAPDGALWFTESGINAIGRMSTAGIVTSYSLPTANSGPHTITLGPDGALWFTEQAASRIGRITLAGRITEFRLPTGGAPWGIVAGPDGALWYTEKFGSELGRVTPKGVFTALENWVVGYCPCGEHPNREIDPREIVRAPSGALWFTEAGNNQIICIGFVHQPCRASSLPNLTPTPPLSATP